MPKKFIKKYLPHPDKIKEHKNLQFLGERLHEPNLWHLNRRSVALAFAIGLFVAWIPTPGQMAIAAVGAFYFRANLPLSVALVWITNPLTMPPLFYFAYRVGLLLLARKPHDDVEFTLENAIAELGDIGAPLLLGSLVVGTISSAAGYFIMSNLWRYYVVTRWNKRKNR